MFYYSVNSKEKVVHYKECCHLKKIKTENLRSFKNVSHVHKDGYRICSCCSPISVRVKKEQASLDKYCMENGLLYYINKGDLQIKTYRSSWKVIVGDRKGIFELHHKNTFKKDHDDSVPGYHKQKFLSKSILGYLEYIIDHEYYRMRNPLCVGVKKLPKKWTKRYKKNQKAAVKKERKRQIWNVIDLIDSLSQEGSKCIV